MYSFSVLLSNNSTDQIIISAPDETIAGIPAWTFGAFGVWGVWVLI